jgi:primosomal protein N' (replication factor Y)
VVLPGAPFVGVALDLPVDRLFTYRVPESLRERARVGHRVRVPFRAGRLVGMIAEVSQTCDLPDVDRVLDVDGIPDSDPLLPADLMRLGRWLASTYGASLGEALAAMVPRGVRTVGKAATRRRVRLARPAAEAAAHADAIRETRNPQARCLRRLAEAPGGVAFADLLRQAMVSPSPVLSLLRSGWLALEEEGTAADPLVAAARAPAAEDAVRPVPTEAQRAAVDAVTSAIGRGAFAPFLLLGVTGSGKTEVYLRAIEACRDAGKQAIVLVPEIALTPQTVRRFRARFDRVAVLHSAMTEADRAAAWRAIRAGEADVVIGPRSAVFAPVPRLGLVVLDEEHETSFKQQNAPRYHARDAALARARDAGAAVVLGSATPSLETYHAAREGRVALLELPARVEGRPLPPVRIVDLRSDAERRGGGSHLSRTLVAALDAALRAGGQAILFLNRRGYSTSVACPRCGFLLRCPHCDVGLTYHRATSLALCHLCGEERRAPTACPDCAFPALRYQGVGTQSIEAELRALFPNVPVARMDSDTMTGRDAYDDALGRFARGEVRVLLGTQMIAKGLHFPRVTLVGVVSADTALVLPDFRAAERTFALIEQVAGRTGRGDRGGEVIVQTLDPGEPAVGLACRHAYAEFAEREIDERRRFGYPPFSRLLRAVFRGRDAEAVAARGAEMASRIAAERIPGVSFLGPATPPVARLKGLLRRHLLVKAEDDAGLAAALALLRRKPAPARGVEEQFDVDPVGML